MKCETCLGVEHILVTKRGNSVYDLMCQYKPIGPEAGAPMLYALCEIRPENQHRYCPTNLYFLPAKLRLCDMQARSEHSRTWTIPFSFSKRMVMDWLFTRTLLVIKIQLG